MHTWSCTSPGSLIGIQGRPRHNAVPCPDWPHGQEYHHGKANEGEGQDQASVSRMCQSASPFVTYAAPVPASQGYHRSLGVLHKLNRGCSFGTHRDSGRNRGDCRGQPRLGQFAEANPPMAANALEGANYLNVCDMADGPHSEEAAELAAGIRAVLRNQQQSFAVEYPCRLPMRRWFIVRVTRWPGDGPIRVVAAQETSPPASRRRSRRMPPPSDTDRSTRSPATSGTGRRRRRDSFWPSWIARTRN